MGLVNNQKAYDQYLIWPEGSGNISAGDYIPGFHFQLRMPNFRGNYLSCIEELRFTLDGEEITSNDVALLLNGKRFLINELAEMYKEYWDVKDCAIIEISKEGGLCGQHQIGAVMRLRYGYSAYFGTCKVVTSRCERTLTF